MARDNTPEALVAAVLRGETDDQGARDLGGVQADRK
jgi:hypothetical protein